VFDSNAIFVYLLSVGIFGVTLFVGFFISYVLFQENYVFMFLLIIGFLASLILRVVIQVELGYPRDEYEDFDK
jgi:hypothetical protein